MRISTMSDDITATTLYNQSNQEQTRYIILGFLIVLMIVDLWLIISLIHYGIKTTKWRRLQPGNPNSLSSGRIYLSVIICSITAFFYHLFYAAYLNVGFQENEDSLCKAMISMASIGYISCFLSIILFLWFRQRTLYTAFLPVTRFTKPLNFFSFIIIFVSFFLGVVGIILAILANAVNSTSAGCDLQNENSLQLIAFASIGSTIIFSQVSLLLLFIYALLSLYGFDVKKRWKFLFCYKRQPSINEPTDRTRIIVSKIIKKVTLFAALSLLFDLLIVCLAFLYPRQGSRIEILSLLPFVTTSMNLYFVILSFIAWKDMIISPCKSFCSR